MGRYRRSRAATPSLNADQLLPLPEWKDAAKRDIQRGQYIVYSAGVGRSSVLKFGIVKELVSKRSQRWQYPDTILGRPGGYVDYLQPKVKAITAYHGSVQNSGSGTTLEHLNRMLIIEEHQIPPEILKALKDAWQGVDP